MFKKDAIFRVGNYEHMPCLEDYFLWIKLINNGCKLKNINKKLVHVRIGNGMFERRSNKEYLSSWKIVNKFMIDRKMIGKIEYLRNVFSIHAFIFMPITLKKIAYKRFLRSSY